MIDGTISRTGVLQLIDYIKKDGDETRKDLKELKASHQELCAKVAIACQKTSDQEALIDELAGVAHKPGLCDVVSEHISREKIILEAAEKATKLAEDASVKATQVAEDAAAKASRLTEDAAAKAAKVVEGADKKATQAVEDADRAAANRRDKFRTLASWLMVLAAIATILMGRGII